MAQPKKTILVGGLDATPDGLKALASGRLAVTVLQSAVGQGRKSVEMALQMIKGLKVDAHQWIPFELVTPQNMQHYSNKKP